MYGRQEAISKRTKVLLGGSMLDKEESCEECGYYWEYCICTKEHWLMPTDAI